MVVPGGGLRNGMVPIRGGIGAGGILEGWMAITGGEINCSGCQVVHGQVTYSWARTISYWFVVPCFLVGGLVEVKFVNSVWCVLDMGVVVNKMHSLSLYLNNYCNQVYKMLHFTVTRIPADLPPLIRHSPSYCSCCLSVDGIVETVIIRRRCARYKPFHRINADGGVVYGDIKLSVGSVLI